ncbi:apolipo L3-like protein [Labeo rohita]|uniref:Apolipo L3-like protein n=1 Tax=Labeo rohita TaxID=84645 RepID=A0A498NE16_LABRO|nr:apolipo L3-like protein [Labeo rohita]
MGSAGGIASIVGLALAPVTLGVSLTLTAIGGVVGVAGGATGTICNIIYDTQQKHLRETIEKITSDFQNTINAMFENGAKTTCLSSEAVKTARLSSGVAKTARLSSDATKTARLSSGVAKTTRLSSEVAKTTRLSSGAVKSVRVSAQAAKAARSAAANVLQSPMGTEESTPTETGLQDNMLLQPETTRESPSIEKKDMSHIPERKGKSQSPNTNVKLPLRTAQSISNEIQVA